MAPGGAVAAGFLREAEAWTGAQCELLSAMGAIWTDWLRRQHEAIDASARSLQQMLECRNLPTFLRSSRNFSPAPPAEAPPTSAPWSASRWS